MRKGILTGTSSWTDPTLLKSGWYPKEAKTAEERLVFYSSHFPVVEVDATYYAMPSERTAGLWVDRTPKQFVFDVKAFALFTQHPANVRGLPKDLREGLPPTRSKVYLKNLAPEVIDEAWERFRSALMPLHSAGKLGAVLFQFPEWFAPSVPNKAYLASLRERLPDYDIAVEFRRNTWMGTPEGADKTLAYLQELGYSYVCVDMPQGFDSSLPPIAAATSSSLAIVRFHGRNRKTWKAPGLTAAQRFNYLYKESELEEWEPKLRELAGEAREVHALFNNCYADKGVRNARQMAELIED
ncbi:MAG TPA: DUF72 domain-containing protein [Actinomycetota bacterium]|nr:DUF72 domain-containing protein [Actinomycetota bacterium]